MELALDNVDDTEGVSHETGDGVEPDCHVKHIHMTLEGTRGWN